MRLKDKVAIITGAANGLGFEASRIFAQEGAKVAMVDYDAKTGEERAAQLKEEGGDVAFFQVNVADRDSVDAMVEEVVKRYSKIDILINNAGITRDGMLTKLSVENFQAVINVNLTGVFHCTQAVVPHMIAQGKGKIISTSSVSGVYGNVGQTNYAATKAGARPPFHRRLAIRRLETRRLPRWSAAALSNPASPCAGASLCRPLSSARARWLPTEPR